MTLPYPLFQNVYKISSSRIKTIISLTVVYHLKWLQNNWMIHKQVKHIPVQTYFSIPDIDESMKVYLWTCVPMCLHGSFTLSEIHDLWSNTSHLLLFFKVFRRVEKIWRTKVEVGCAFCFVVIMLSGLQMPLRTRNGQGWKKAVLNWIYASQWFKPVLTGLNRLKLIKASLN